MTGARWPYDVVFDLFICVSSFVYTRCPSFQYRQIIRWLDIDVGFFPRTTYISVYLRYLFCLNIHVSFAPHALYERN